MCTIAVIGCGYWGPNLIRNFSSLPDVRVKSICDMSEDRLRHMQTLYPHVITTTNYEELIQDEEIDGIAIATPVWTHYDLASKCLAAGKHVFIEKPMASSVEECVSLLEQADLQKVTLMVGHTFIYSPVIRRIKQTIDSGDIGDILYVSSRRLNLGLFQNDINVAWDLAPHDISIILYFLKQDPVSVNCQGKAHIRDDIEDVTIMSLNYDNGSFATIQSSWLDPNKVRDMIIVGSKRMIVYDDVATIDKIRIYDKRVEAPPHYDTFAEFHYSYHYGDIYSPYVKQVEPLRIQCQHFVDCVLTGQRPITSGREGLKVVQILEASSKSLKNDGMKVDIEDFYSLMRHRKKETNGDDKQVDAINTPDQVGI